ncbi:MAG: hypothetical protein JW797_14010 [Bradymonadales bacterium]|nr:hypothetical protein [Bradymonadales bacterium]
MKKKILAVLLPILIIVAGLVLLYLFVLKDAVDPPPDKVMRNAIEAAQLYVNNLTDANNARFVQNFSNRCQENLRREWRAQRIDGTPRGSWFDIARGLLNSDGTRPEILAVELPEEEAEEGQDLQATVRIKIDRNEHAIPFIREDGRWRIDIPSHPEPWMATPPPAE